MEPWYIAITVGCIFFVSLVSIAKLSGGLRKMSLPEILACLIGACLVGIVLTGVLIVRELK